MKKHALIVMAAGFEDIEAVAPIDILNRVDVDVTVAGLHNGPIQGAYGTTVLPHMGIDEVSEGLFDVIIFPGGRRNAAALGKHPRVIELARRHNQAGKLVAAICAAPSHVLAEGAGIVKGKRATGDPDFNQMLAAGGAIVTDELVTVDGNLITGMGPGAALPFALMLAERLVGKDTADGFAQKWRFRR